MEYDLQKTVLERYVPSYYGTISQEELTESIVPDAYPDISRIVSSSGEASLTAKQTSEGTIKVSGIACLTVLYIPEGESSPRSLSYDIPFQCTADSPNIKETQQVHAKMIGVSADARLMNPRKVLLKAEITVNVAVYGQEFNEVCCDAQGHEDVCGLEKQMTEYRDYVISAVVEKPFVFSELLRQSASKPRMEEVIEYHTELGSLDVKYIGKKIVCKGELHLSMLYRSGLDLVPAHFDLPYSQIIDVENGAEEGDPEASILLKSVVCQLQEGELEVAVEAQIQAVLWSQRKITFLNDVYSTLESLEAERAEYQFCSMSECSSRRETARQFCESGIPVKQVLSGTAYAGQISAHATDTLTKYETVLAVQVLYLSDDDALCAVEYSIPASCELEVSDGCSCKCICKVVGDVIAVPVTGGLEIRVETEYSWRVTKMETVSYVAGIRSMPTQNLSEAKPSVILRMVSDNESIWEIAKLCGSTVKDICSANELTTDSLNPGMILLIPTKRM